MNPERGSSVPWVVLGLLAALLCCLCVILVVSGTALVAAGWGWDVLATHTSQPDVPVSRTPAGGEEPGPTATPYELPWERGPASSEAEAMRQELAAALVPEADPVELAERLQGLVGIPRVLAETAAPIPVGTVDAFWILNDDTMESLQVEAEMVYATPHVYFWIEQGVDYDLNDVRGLVDVFENRIYPTNREFFGSEWTPGIDGDQHLYILFTRNLGSGVAGYYWSNDEYSPLVNEYTNGHEMFYVSADTQHLADEYTYSTLAHEFQHMIHWHGDGNEDNWVDEGFAELASFLNGYDTGGWDYVFAEDPDQTLTYWPSGPDAGIHYGQAFLIMAYFLDRFGEEASRALVAHPANGLDAMDQTLAALDVRDPQTGALIGADDFFRDFAAALLLLDPSVGDGRYSLESYPGAPSLSAESPLGPCPVVPREFEVNQYGIDIHTIECSGEHTLVFDGRTSIEIVPAQAHSGEHALWSNRGNASDMRLTRTFDLQGVEGPIELSYWVWFDIEEEWDYAYLEVSDDGGETWRIMTTPSGTADDPMGTSYGWGYTGYSGGGTRPEWVEETVDLSAYAGSEVLLRFEYVTDAAVNGDGLLVDNVSIPALGYSEDFETDAGGWEAEGFVRLYNELPQTYRLALVQLGSSTQVTEIPVDADGHAQIDFQMGEEYDQAFLLVIGTARYTWQPAPYRIEVR